MLAAPLRNSALDLVFQYQPEMSYPYSPYNLDSSDPDSPWTFEPQVQLQPQQHTASFQPDTPSNLSHSSAASPIFDMHQSSPVESPLPIMPDYAQDPSRPSSYETPRTIQLEERGSAPPSGSRTVQYRFESIDDSHFLRQQESADSRRRGSSKAPVRAVVDEMSPSTRPSSSGAGPSRVPHGRPHTQSHPYSRPSLGPASPSSGTSPGKRAASREDKKSPGAASSLTAGIRPERMPDNDFSKAEHNARPSRGVPAPSLPFNKAAVPCPGMSVWRVPSTHSEQRDQETIGGGAGAAATSTGETSPAVAQSDAHPTAQASQSSAPKAPARQTRLLISTDMYIDKDNNEVVVILELPGLNKSSVRINLVTCPYSGCRQLAVQARSRSTVPDGPIAVRERKTGDCHRTIFVPLSTKPEDVSAKIEDGLLTIKFPGGTHVRQDPQEVDIQ